MHKIYMLITFLALPYYWVRSFFIRKSGDPEKIARELKTYPRDYFGIRGKKVTPIGDTTHIYPNCVYLSNHQSHNDIFIVLDAIQKPFRFIAKKELFSNPATGPFMRMSQSYPLDRDDPRQSLTQLKQAVNDINAGCSVLAFPEGTRSHQAEMLEFKAGMFSMLRKSTVPLVPLYIKDSFNEQTKNYEIYFGDPILPEVFQSMKGTELCDYVRARMEELKEHAYA
ncbi:1-acyl-sn-glycerol-3-phosphate acyltransferase [Erysipelothrix sp. HDW6C]|uniref:lysophospholipid acyltransferase family protein n=1 Tax=Erysipelothrix sp. HDW6C TaxID=2714930 RepID=UPI0014089D41|nr:lysophospholipid acyltransferase family protein [Erysipelothrix sp. HDW6C]QIK69719.1 1-acyl-sn-glycerol-3-phosphate acyltransferase [Erysipelothrix sp. HDW6C]